MVYESNCPPSKEKEKSFASIRNDLLLPLWSKDWGKRGIFCEVSMVGISGMAKGAGARVGGLGKTWLDPWSGGDGEGIDGGGG